jgi:hypothetical protein
MSLCPIVHKLKHEAPPELSIGAGNSNVVLFAGPPPTYWTKVYFWQPLVFLGGDEQGPACGGARSWDISWTWPRVSSVQ